MAGIPGGRKIKKGHARLSIITGRSRFEVLVMVVVVVPAIVVTFTSFASAVPVMVVLNPSMVSVPVAHVILAALIARSDPGSPGIGRPSPVTVMPPIPATIWIPVPIYPVIVTARSHRPHSNHPGARRLTNPDSHGYLSVNRRRSHHKNQDKQYGKDKFLHIRFPLLKWNTCRNNFFEWDDAQKGVVVEVLEVLPAYPRETCLAIGKGRMCLVGTPWKHILAFRFWFSHRTL
jgi:hypothetical protein